MRSRRYPFNLATLLELMTSRPSQSLPGYVPPPDPTKRPPTMPPAGDSRKPYVPPMNPEDYQGSILARMRPRPQAQLMEPELDPMTLEMLLRQLPVQEVR